MHLHGLFLKSTPAYMRLNALDVATSRRLRRLPRAQRQLAKRMAERKRRDYRRLLGGSHDGVNVALVTESVRRYAKLLKFF